MEENPGMAHKIVLNNRDQGNLTGILDVISFDENTIVLDTDMGLLTIKGKDLHVNRLSLEKGEIDILFRLDIHTVLFEFGGSRLLLRQRLLECLFPCLVFQITFSQGSSADMDNHSKASYDHRDPDQRHPVTQTVSRSSFVPSVPVFSHDSSLPS